MLNAVILPEMVLKLPFAFNFQTISFCYAICKDEQQGRLNYTREEFTKSFCNPKILHYGEKPWKYLKSYFDSKGQNIAEIWWDYAGRTAEFGQDLLEKRGVNKDYLYQAWLGFRVLESLESWLSLFKIHTLLKDFKEESKIIEEASEISDRLFGLCLILGEMIMFARRKNRGVLSVFLKAKKSREHLTNTPIWLCNNGMDFSISRLYGFAKLANDYAVAFISIEFHWWRLRFKH